MTEAEREGGRERGRRGRRWERVSKRWMAQEKKKIRKLTEQRSSTITDRRLFCLSATECAKVFIL